MQGPHWGSGRSDRALLNDCLGDDPLAWTRLVSRYDAYVRAVLRAAGAPDVDEARQEVFVRAYERIHTLRDGTALRHWLAAIARHVAADGHRRRRREWPCETPVGVAEPGDPELFERVDAALDVRCALRGLPRAQREVLDRLYTRDEPYAEVAAAMGVPPGTVASRAARALSRLRERLEDPVVVAVRS